MFGLGLRRLLPASLRPPVVRAVSSVAERHRAALLQHRFERFRKDGNRTFVGDRVAVIGMLTARCGIGRGARLMVEDLRARRIDVIPVDVTHRLGDPVGLTAPDSIAPSALVDYRPTDVIIHYNPPKFASALALLAPAVLRSASVVAYWSWELERAPSEWRASVGWCDEIWVPSAFVADALLATFATATVRVVPHAVDRDPVGPRDRLRRDAARQKIGIPADAFVAGTSWSMLSNFERKGAVFAIAAFQAAFPFQPGSRELLLLRCRDGDAYPGGMRIIRDAATRDPRIVVLDDHAKALGILDFYQAIDTYLSLSRSEGYGLPIAEAAQAGLPVLATGWGLAADLAKCPLVSAINYRLVPVEDPQHMYDGIAGAVWAEPDVEDAAQRLRTVAYAAEAFTPKGATSGAIAWRFGA